MATSNSKATISKLTDAKIKALPAPKRQKLYSLGGNGLYLRVQPSGHKAFVHKSRGVWSTIGHPPAMLLEAARARVGVVSRNNTEATTGEALEMFFQTYILKRWKVTKNAKTYVERFKSGIGAVPLRTLQRADIVRVLLPWSARVPVSAARGLSTFRLFCQWCISMGMLDADPTNGISAKMLGLIEKPRDRVLSDAEILSLMRNPAPRAPLLQFLLYTGLRIREAQRAQRQHIDGDWLNIPAEHSKNGKAHKVFLHPAAAALFTACTKDTDHLFPYCTATNIQAWARRNIEGDWTPHDLRRTYITRQIEHGCPPHIASALVNHSFDGGSTFRTYVHANLDAQRAEWTWRWGERLSYFTKRGKWMTPTEEMNLEADIAAQVWNGE